MALFPRWLQQGFDALTQPLARWLAARGIAPNTITTVGTAILLGSGAAFAAGAVRAGGALLLVSGLCDVLDGKVARGHGAATTFGAFYDSTLDRIGEAVLFLGIAWYFVSGGLPGQLGPVGMVAAFVAGGAGLIVSYTRARAEGLGLECRVGIAQRAERIVGLGGSSLLFGAGPNGYLLLAIVVILAALAVITVGQRMVYVHRISHRGASRAGPGPEARLADPVGKGERVK